MVRDLASISMRKARPVLDLNIKGLTLQEDYLLLSCPFIHFNWSLSPQHLETSRYWLQSKSTCSAGGLVSPGISRISTSLSSSQSYRGIGWVCPLLASAADFTASSLAWSYERFGYSIAACCSKHFLPRVWILGTHPGRKSWHPILQAVVVWVFLVWYTAPLSLVPNDRGTWIVHESNHLREAYDSCIWHWQLPCAPVYGWLIPVTLRMTWYLLGCHRHGFTFQVLFW